MGQPRRALITGTSCGLGRAIAVALAREGYDLALTEISADALNDTLAEPEIKKRKVVAVALDLRSLDSINSAFERATKELGDLDLLINNAGRALLKPVAEVTEAEWDDVIDTTSRARSLSRNCSGGIASGGTDRASSSAWPRPTA